MGSDYFLCFSEKHPRFYRGGRLEQQKSHLMLNSKRFNDRIPKEHQAVFDMGVIKESAHSK